MGTFTSILNLFKPATSDFVDVVADLNDNSDKLETALGPLITPWTTYTPTWTSDATNPTLGNGTAVGRYKQIGKTVWCVGQIVIGSTSTLGSGNWYVGLPVKAKSLGLNGTILANGYLLDAGVAAYTVAYAGLLTNGDNSIQLGVMAGTANRNAFGIGPTQPWAWGTGDTMGWAATYEAF